MSNTKDRMRAAILTELHNIEELMAFNLTTLSMDDKFLEKYRKDLLSQLAELELLID